MVYQYAVKITKDLDICIFDSLLEIVSNERKKNEKYKNPMDQWRSLFAGIILPYALKQFIARRRLGFVWYLRRIAWC